MTIDEILELAKQNTDTNFLLHRGQIRAGLRCPLEVAANTPPYSMSEAAVILGLNPAETHRIVHAVDNIEYEYSINGVRCSDIGCQDHPEWISDLRKRILKELGL